MYSELSPDPFLAIVRAKRPHVLVVGTRELIREFQIHILRQIPSGKALKFLLGKILISTKKYAIGTKIWLHQHIGFG